MDNTNKPEVPGNDDWFENLINGNQPADDKDDLELELKKKEYETKIARLLEGGNWQEAKPLLDDLAAVIEKM